MPTVAHLRKFDVVVVWTASWARDGGATEFNRRAAGNLLADFVERGGKVRTRTRLTATANCCQLQLQLRMEYNYMQRCLSRGSFNRPPSTCASGSRVVTVSLDSCFKGCHVLHKPNACWPVAGSRGDAPRERVFSQRCLTPAWCTPGCDGQHSKAKRSGAGWFSDVGERA